MPNLLTERSRLKPDSRATNLCNVTWMKCFELLNCQDINSKSRQVHTCFDLWLEVLIGWIPCWSQTSIDRNSVHVTTSVYVTVQKNSFMIWSGTKRWVRHNSIVEESQCDIGEAFQCATFLWALHTYTFLLNANLPRCHPVVLAHFVFVDFDHREQLIRYAYQQAETQEEIAINFLFDSEIFQWKKPTSLRMLEDLVREESRAVNWTSSYSLAINAYEAWSDQKYS